MEHLKDELNDSPKLRALKSRVQQPHIPDGYFDSLHASVENRLKDEGVWRSASQPSGGRYLPYTWYRYAIAATLVGTVAVGAMWLQVQRTKTAQHATELTTADAEAYVLAHLELYDPHELVPHTEDWLQVIPQPTFETESPKEAQPTEIELNLLDELSEEDLESML